MARNLIETLLHSWKDYKNNKKRERKQMSLEKCCNPYFRTSP